MCACGSGKITITDTFIVDPSRIDLVELSVNKQMTATRKSVSPISGKQYYYGGHYTTVLALPEDIDWLLSLSVAGVLVFSESE